jgi:TonB-dependent SusC/RagA subfamily outer membrane receptor
MALLLGMTVSAQTITSVHGTLSDDMGPLMGATVCEMDATGRIINSAITDLNGNFTMKVKNDKDKIRFTYVGLKTVTLPINKTTYNITMQSATQLKEVVVKSRKRATGNGLPIPEKEISYASQTISMKEFEGLGITTVDEALQGRIAGLDIIGNSGDLGAGSTMRLRGSSSLSSLTDSNPLIVVDGNIREVNLENFDMAGANNEKFAELLNINPEDIASITVKKDAAATAIYGSQGGNGVIEITTKRGARGKPKLTYSLKLTGTYQPKGYDLLSGDDYTMLLKEAYFNPTQNDVVVTAEQVIALRLIGAGELE